MANFVEFTCNLCGVRTENQIRDGKCAGCGRPLSARTDRLDRDFNQSQVVANMKGTAPEHVAYPTALSGAMSAPIPYAAAASDGESAADAAETEKPSRSRKSSASSVES